jgi:hypothetical protein
MLRLVCLTCSDLLYHYMLLNCARESEFYCTRQLQQANVADVTATTFPTPMLRAVAAPRPCRPRGPISAVGYKTTASLKISQRGLSSVYIHV